jgi:2-keto-4-pentenoate hydratase
MTRIVRFHEIGGPEVLKIEEIAVRLVAERGEKLQAGDIVMAGAATAAEPLQAGQFVKLTLERLGSVSFNVLT